MKRDPAVNPTAGATTAGVPAVRSDDAPAARAEGERLLDRAFQFACSSLSTTRDKGEAYVRAQPLKSVAIVASVAAVIGMLFARR
jgi:ElaB/YqjD/DUF883 family membrane-anchored ribosome-binding protein